MSNTQERQQQQFPVRLTMAQRLAVAEASPDLSHRLRLDETNERMVFFTLDEMRAIHQRTRFIDRAASGMKRNSLRHVVYTTEQAIQNFQGIGAIAPKLRLYQFKIVLSGIKPPIWRRIQLRDCTLDKLHERIQTAMGWTNSHLHHFKISDKRYGDPWLLDDGFEDEESYEDSTVTMLSEVLPRSGERFHFEYEYDFGDGWEHDVVFEGCLKVAPGERYPLCVEGERACPPEDVGGTSGYEEFLEVLAGPVKGQIAAEPDPYDDDDDAPIEIDDELREQYLTWIGGSFDPDAFDAESATKRMRRGLPNWRRGV